MTPGAQTEASGFFFEMRAPALRASESAMAIAWGRFVTTVPDPPERSVPRLNSESTV